MYLCKMKKLFYFGIFLLFIFGCKHELERPSWNTEVLIPIASSNLNISNIIPDSTTEINENGLISLIFQQKFIDINLDTLIQIDATIDEQTNTLANTSFADVVIADTATIGEAINELPFGSTLLPDGSNNIIPYLPGILNGDTINIDASEYFETMTLYEGTLIVEIKNGYPTEISNINLSLINISNQTIIGNFNFPFIASGETITDSISIAGQTIDENILGVLNNLDINSSNTPVLIDYTDAIITTISLTNLGITEATAIFPEQQLTANLEEHSFELGTAQIDKISIAEGTVKVNVLSTLPNGKMIYNIPSLTKDGIPFSSGDLIVPEATNSNLTTFSFDFEGYVLDLSGKEGRIGGDTVNTIYTESYTYIDYTGTLEEINQTDSFYSFVEFNISPEYTTGFIGQDTITIGPEIIETNLFNFIESGNIDLQSAKMNIELTNFIGADAAIQINNLSALNDINEVSAIFDNTKKHNIARSTVSSFNSTITPTFKTIEIEVDNMLEILPNKINTSASFYINPNGQSNTKDFLYPEYTVDANINLEVPLNIIANNLTFIDTAIINLPNEESYEIEKIYLNIENGFPFDTEIELILLDQNNLVIDTLEINTMISAASIDENNFVTNTTNNTIELNYNSFKNISKLITISKLTTIPTNEYVSLYSNYEIDFKLNAKVSKILGE